MGRQVHGEVAEPSRGRIVCGLKAVSQDIGRINREFSILLDTTSDKFLISKPFDFLEKCIDCLASTNVEPVKPYEVIHCFDCDAAADSPLAAAAIK
jgi:hypothetical protein